MESLSKLKDVNLFNLPKLFEDKVNSKMGAVIKALKNHAVGYGNKHKAADLLPYANSYLKNGVIADDYELRMIIKELRNSETFLRIIGSSPGGTWLACLDDEVDANKTNLSRFGSNAETLIKNGANISLLFTMLNDLKKLYYPVHNQGRHQINTEKTIIKRYSGDLIDKDNEK